jgi:hypothetical protein
MARRKQPRAERSAAYENNCWTNARNQPKKQRAKSRTRIGDRVMDNDVVYALDLSEYERHIGFCCAKCTCSEKRKDKFSNKLFLPDKDARITHRRCCHRVKEGNGEVDPSCTPSRAMAANRAQRKLGEMDPDAKPKAGQDDEDQGDEDEANPFAPTEQDPDKALPVDEKVLWNWYKQAKNRETSYNNNTELEREDDRLNSIEGYNNNRLKFEEEMRRRSRQPMEPAVVLDLFSGIGGAVVALKRVGIDIKRVSGISSRCSVYSSNSNHCFPFFTPFLAAHSCRA